MLLTIQLFFFQRESFLVSSTVRHKTALGCHHSRGVPPERTFSWIWILNFSPVRLSSDLVGLCTVYGVLALRVENLMRNVGIRLEGPKMLQNSLTDNGLKPRNHSKVSVFYLQGENNTRTFSVQLHKSSQASGCLPLPFNWYHITHTHTIFYYISCAETWDISWVCNHRLIYAAWR